MLVTVIKSPYRDVQPVDIGEAARHRHNRSCLRSCDLWQALGHLFRTRELKRV